MFLVWAQERKSLKTTLEVSALSLSSETGCYDDLLIFHGLQKTNLCQLLGVHNKAEQEMVI